MAGDDLTWVYSEGGPLIVLPAKIVHHWRGIEPPPGVSAPVGWSWGMPGGPVSDYDRACAVDDYLGVLKVGPGFGLVLGDEPLTTAFIPSADGGILVRSWYAEQGTDHRHLATSAPASIWSETPHRLRMGRGGALIFDSALPGDGLLGEWARSNWLGLPLSAGNYRVDLADYKPDRKTHMQLVRLMRTPR